MTANGVYILEIPKLANTSMTRKQILTFLLGSGKGKSECTKPKGKYKQSLWL